MARKPAVETTGADSFVEHPVWTDDLAVGAAATDDPFFSTRNAAEERIPALVRPPAKNSAQPHAAWRRIDQYREDKRLRELIREVYDE